MNISYKELISWLVRAKRISSTLISILEGWINFAFVVAVKLIPLIISVKELYAYMIGNKMDIYSLLVPLICLKVKVPSEFFAIFSKKSE